MERHKDIDKESITCKTMTGQPLLPFFNILPWKGYCRNLCYKSWKKVSAFWASYVVGGCWCTCASRRMVMALGEPCVLWNRSWKVFQWRIAFACVPQHLIYFPAGDGMCSHLQKVMLLYLSFKVLRVSKKRRKDFWAVFLQVTPGLSTTCAAVTTNAYLFWCVASSVLVDAY